MADLTQLGIFARKDRFKVIHFYFMAGNPLTPFRITTFWGIPRPALGSWLMVAQQVLKSPAGNPKELDRRNLAKCPHHTS